LILLANFSRWRRSSDASRAAGHFLAESRPPIQVMCLRANGGPVRDLILKRARRAPQLDRGVDTRPVARKRVRTKDGA